MRRIRCADSRRRAWPPRDGDCLVVHILFSYAESSTVARMTDHLLPLAAAIALAALPIVVALAVRALRRRDVQAADKQLLELGRLQAETAVRIEAMRDVLAGRQAELHRAVNERL